MHIQKEELKIDRYDYPLPDERIAKYPLANRDQSKLLLYQDDRIGETIFSNLAEQLPAHSLLISNNTKVIQARMFFQKPSGAHIEIFCLEPYAPADYNQAFAAEKTASWVCLVGNLKKWKEGPIELKVSLAGEELVLRAYREQSKETGHVIRFEWDAPFLFGQILEQVGQLPIPPYLNRETEESDLERYQTIYSKIQGSVAAPTAGLHFTPEVFSTLENKSIQRHEVTLHVGAGTFRPVKAENAAAHEMHSEHFVIKRKDIEALLTYEGNITVVGTTSVRTVESIYWLGVKELEGQNEPAYLSLAQWDAYQLPGHYSLQESLQALAQRMDAQGTDALQAATGIMIVPGYRFQVVQRLITNFHQPKSTLLLLIAAFVGDQWKQIYDYALAHDFRFLSYGDSCFLCPA